MVAHHNERKFCHVLRGDGLSQTVFGCQHTGRRRRDRVGAPKGAPKKRERSSAADLWGGTLPRMARKLIVEYEGAIYHLTVRSNGGRGSLATILIADTCWAGLVKRLRRIT